MYRMTKKALLIGANYNGANQLYGCINDIIQMKGLLIDVYGFQPSDIVTLRDDDPSNMPTKTRILKELVNLVTSTADFVFIQYSGHGTNIADKNMDEKDGRDECIVPSDYSASGIISDDELNNALTGLKGTGIAVFDCCHSGTILDLQFNTINATNKATTSGGLYCFSGCLDNQLASETFADVPGLPQGAMTDAFISALRTLKYYPGISALYTELNTSLRSNGFDQIPFITSNIEVTPTTAFPYINDVSTHITITVPDQTIVSLNTTLNAQISALNMQLITLNTQVSLLNGQNSAFKSQITTLSGQNVTLTSQINTNKAIAATSNAQVNTLTTQVNTLKIQNAGLTVQVKSNNAIVATSSAQINTLTAQVNTLKIQNAGLTVQVKSNNAIDATSSAQINTLKLQNAGLAAQITTFIGQNNMLKTQLTALQRK
jgi:Caspase domain